MKLQFQIIFVLHIFLLSAVPYCSKHVCKSTESRFDASKSWLPLKGKTQLSFLDNTGHETTFDLQVIDTVRTDIDPDCGATHISEYIGIGLFMNQPARDFIAFSFNPPNFLVVTGVNGDTPNFYLSDVFKRANEGRAAKRLSNYTIGNKTYTDVILMLGKTSDSNTIDSVFMANNVGIVGFNYAGKKYSLQ